MKPVILIVEDDPDGARSMTDAAEDAGFATVLAGTAAKGLECFREQTPDLVLTDLVLPDFDGIELLTRIKRINAAIPVMVMTAYGSVESSVKAMRAGAYDYVIKPLDLDDIQTKLRRAAETSRLRREVTTLTVSARARYTATTMIAESPAMRAVIHQIEAIADTTATVLIQGESGTGKELVSRALHADSRRAEAPFVAVNCGAFAESLLESELFGHEKGAFTGAFARHAGAFERADGGTLFLDEIGDAPPSVQVKLLRAIEEREIHRVGGREPFAVNVRLVSASNKDLAERVAEGAFREDLLYRLNVVTLTLPPLRRRREDIRPLADRFIARAAADHGHAITGIDPAFYARLEAYDWPGNIRQLRNVIESAVLLASGPNLSAKALNLPGESASRVATGYPENLTLAAIERLVLEQTLTRCEGNRTLTAEKLGISTRTIQRKIKEHNPPF
ncbi:MAG: sigma-54 dependent transcriptional regulator [Lentisphaerota bacterium]